MLVKPLKRNTLRFGADFRVALRNSRAEATTGVIAKRRVLVAPMAQACPLTSRAAGDRRCNPCIAMRKFDASVAPDGYGNTLMTRCYAFATVATRPHE